MTEYLLKRTGAGPLAFAGTLIAESDGRWSNGRENNRWHKLAVYRTGKGVYVIHVEYRTIWQGEESHAWATTVPSVDGVAAELRAYDPTAYVMGFPPNAVYTEKQERLLADLRLRYENQVSDVLDSPEFAERV